MCTEGIDRLENCGDLSDKNDLEPADDSSSPETTLETELTAQMPIDPRKAMQAEMDRALERAEALKRDMAEYDRAQAEEQRAAAEKERIAARWRGEPGSESFRERPKPGQKPPKKTRARKASAASQQAPSVANMADLILQYRTDERSPYHKVKHATRRGYDANLQRIEQICGAMSLADIDEAHIRALYAAWSKDGQHEPIAYALLTMFRMLIAFGVTKLKDRECSRISVIVRYLGISPPKGRAGRDDVEPMTEEYAKRIIRRCLDNGRMGMALAQALQFECRIYQKAALGEWVPLDDPEKSEVIVDDEKWVRGIRWSHIDQNLILRHSLDDTPPVPIDLKRHPMVMAELNKIMPLPRNSEPVIIDEDTGKPYLTWKFRRLWRSFATRVGVPKGVFNMDSRSNASDGDEGDGESDAEGSRAAR